MSQGKDSQADSLWVYEEVRLPLHLRPGRYDGYGNEDPEGNVFLGQGGNICHIWAVLSEPLEAGQTGSMSFADVPGSYALTGNVSEWVRGGSGYSPHAVERGAQGNRSKLIRKELGTWDITVDTYLEPGKPPLRVEAVEVNDIGANGWLYSEYVAKDFLGIPFKQQAFLAREEATNTYVASRIKTLQDNISHYRGQYDETTKTLVLEADVVAGGAVEHERRETTYIDDDTKHFKVYRRSAGQDYRLSDEGVAKRRPDPSNGNFPRSGIATASIVSLSRGNRSARVIGRNESSGPLDMALGIVILGPVYMLQFEGSFRP